MELLVMTLAYMVSGRDADVLTRIRHLSDAMRNAPGLTDSRFYRGRGNDATYIILTTWDDEESWRRAQDRHNPKQLLLSNATELLSTSPRQWLMRYLWGYTRPIVVPSLAAAHLTAIRGDQIMFAQQGCIQGLRQQELQTILAFAFLAKGMTEESTPLHTLSSDMLDLLQQDAMLFALFSWANEEDRDDFYADSHYRALSAFMSNLGTQHILPLEPI